MNLAISPLNLETIWLHAFWNYIESCVKAGKSYLPHEEQNIAVIAVQIADSVCKAFKAREPFFNGSGTGQLSPVAVSNSIPSLVDTLDKMMSTTTPKSVTNIIDEGFNRFRPSTSQKTIALPAKSLSPRMR